jgi:hypothetical protein
MVLKFKYKNMFLKKLICCVLKYLVYSIVIISNHVFVYRKKNKLKLRLKSCTLYSGAVRERPLSVLCYLVYICDDMAIDDHTA